MRESLATPLEQLSYYQHQELKGGIERPIHAFRVLDVRGTRYFVLTQIQDVGLDFTQRTNFLAHHLIFTSEEIASFGAPPLIFLYWDGWKQSWDGDPELLSRENWGNLHTIKGFESDPARHYETAPARSWEKLTGAAVHAFGLLDLRGSAWLTANEESDEDLLRLLAESLRMMELRNRDVDYRAKAWEFTFTTNFQEQDNPNDFRWKCVHSEALNSVKMQAEAVSLREVRSKRHTAEENDFATIGPHPAVIVEAPTEVTVNEGEDVKLQVDARGIPYPNVEWYWNGKLLAESSNSECAIRNLKPGTDQFCEVRVRNNYAQLSTRIRVRSLAVARKASQLEASRPKAGPTTPYDYSKLSIQNLITLILDPQTMEASYNECILELGNRRHCFFQAEPKLRQKLVEHISEHIEKPRMERFRDLSVWELGLTCWLRFQYLKLPLLFGVCAAIALISSLWLGWHLLEPRVSPKTKLLLKSEGISSVAFSPEWPATNALHLSLRFSPFRRTAGSVIFTDVSTNNTAKFTIEVTNQHALLSIKNAAFAPNVMLSVKLNQSPASSNLFETITIGVRDWLHAYPADSNRAVHTFTLDKTLLKTKGVSVSSGSANGTVTVSGYLPSALVAPASTKKN